MPHCGHLRFSTQLSRAIRKYAPSPETFPMSLRRHYGRTKMDHYKNLPEAVSVPSVLDLKDDDHHDGRHQDRCGQHRQYRKHFEVPPSHNARERAERGFVPIKRVIQTKRPPTEAALLPDYAALSTHERGVSVDLAGKS